jgi:hypothetical protein
MRVLKCGHKFHKGVRIIFDYLYSKHFENKNGIFSRSLYLCLQKRF